MCRGAGCARRALDMQAERAEYRPESDLTCGLSRGAGCAHQTLDLRLDRALASVCSAAQEQEAAEALLWDHPGEEARGDTEEASSHDGLAGEFSSWRRTRSLMKGCSA